MSRLSRDEQRNQERAEHSAAPAATPIDVRVPGARPAGAGSAAAGSVGTGSVGSGSAGGGGAQAGAVAGGASVDGVPVFAAPGEEIQHAVLDHLHRIALAAGRPVLATVHDERIGYVVPLRVDPDGSSHLASEPTPTAPPEAAAPPLTDTPEPELSAPGSGRDKPTHLLRPVDPERESAPTFRLPAVPEPPRSPAGGSAPTFALRALPTPAEDPKPGTLAPPTGVFGPPPSMNTAPATGPAAGPTRIAPAPVPGTASGPAPARGPLSAPAHGTTPGPVSDASHGQLSGRTPEPTPAPVSGGTSGPERRSAPGSLSGPASGRTSGLVSDASHGQLSGRTPEPTPAPGGTSDPERRSAPGSLSGPASGTTPGLVSEASHRQGSGRTSEPTPGPVSGGTPGPIPGPAPAPIPRPAAVTPTPQPFLDPDPKPTPARGFDAVAEAVLGDEPLTAPGDGTAPALLAEPTARINDAVKAGRTEAAARLAEEAVAEATGTLGPEHPEVLRLRELTAYIAYLSGDPGRAFRLSLDLARIHRRAGDAEAAYGNVQSAATAWRAVRDPARGLELGQDLLGLWAELAAEEGPAADDAEQLESARARMGRLTERARAQSG
ncbi:tetratricopeptide repeat protein [Streptomyces viridiviolaceus]